MHSGGEYEVDKVWRCQNTASLNWQTTGEQAGALPQPCSGLGRADPTACTPVSSTGQPSAHHCAARHACGGAHGCRSCDSVRVRAAGWRLLEFPEPCGAAGARLERGTRPWRGAVRRGVRAAARRARPLLWPVVSAAYNLWFEGAGRLVGLGAAGGAAARYALNEVRLPLTRLPLPSRPASWPGHMGGHPPSPCHRHC